MREEVSIVIISTSARKRRKQRFNTRARKRRRKRSSGVVSGESVLADRWMEQGEVSLNEMCEGRVVKIKWRRPGMVSLWLVVLKYHHFSLLRLEVWQLGALLRLLRFY